MDWQSWSSLTEPELATRDIAEINLALAEGLPGSEQLDAQALLRKIDDWAQIVEHETARASRLRPKYGDLSDNQFRILAMVTTLQGMLGVKYNLATLKSDVDATDSRTQFIHGLLTGHGGTCVTMPILYAAVGRRLSYPIKLAFAMEHVFCRWDDSTGERFNIEATSRGYVSHCDDDYLVWPKPIPERELKRGRFLRSLSRSEELALCFDQRGHCWLDNLRTIQALEAYAHAHGCAPHDDTYVIHHDVAMVMHRAMVRVQIRPNEEYRLPLPPPQDGIEKRLYRLAEEQFDRIQAIRSAKTAGERRAAVIE